MSWRLASLGPAGHVKHLVEGWRPVTAAETRYLPACGSADNSPVPTISDGAVSICLLCLRRVLLG